MTELSCMQQVSFSTFLCVNCLPENTFHCYGPIIEQMQNHFSNVVEQIIAQEGVNEIVCQRSNNCGFRVLVIKLNRGVVS